MRPANSAAAINGVRDMICLPEVSPVRYGSSNSLPQSGGQVTKEAPSMNLPLGPEVDTTPRPLPARVPLRGQHVVLEPLHRRHAAELWRAAQGADESFT